MPRGGSKPGERRGGRQKGTCNTKTRAIAEKAINEGITPLEVMLGTMRYFWECGQFADAAEIAKDAAPYIHPKLSAVEFAAKAKLDHKITFCWQD